MSYYGDEEKDVREERNRNNVCTMAHESSLSNSSPINEIWQDKTKKPYPIRSIRCTDDCSIEWTLITHSRADRSDLISRNAATGRQEHGFG